MELPTENQTPSDLGIEPTSLGDRHGDGPGTGEATQSVDRPVEIGLPETGAPDDGLTESERERRRVEAAEISARIQTTLDLAAKMALDMIEQQYPGLVPAKLEGETWEDWVTRNSEFIRARFRFEQHLQSPLFEPETRADGTINWDDVESLRATYYVTVVTFFDTVQQKYLPLTVSLILWTGRAVHFHAGLYASLSGTLERFRAEVRAARAAREGGK